ncbi:MAG: response regulator [Candidatus Aminicenantes bacterium]|nr:response regulator [Candidatus Aminicenantes bacterium]NIM78236.1 response regulator [Candidatus Aminicenantes bacterium]NIN23742.1 response regulator [Candidatus Aminicenantes bacterium]NIN47449.1 response regulator [Candidatus Aminicenantes bacterium]NIN90377.1 response regulator [Candidatus Aminicenantes bacterium]
MVDVDIKAVGPGKTSILIVDDMPQNLQVLVNILREKDYKISVAPGGRKALEMVNIFLPDLILLDIVMPQPDGFQVCKKLKASPKTKDIPIIFLSAKTETEDIVKGFELGAVDYVTKPFKKAELLARISTHLELRKAREEIICLEQKNAALAVAVTANHTINQPLTVLQGNFELFQGSIEKDLLTEKQQRFLTRMKESIERIKTFLLEMSDSPAIHFENYVESRKMVVFERKAHNLVNA